MEKTSSIEKKLSHTDGAEITLQPSHYDTTTMISITAEEDKATQRKLDLVLMPLLGFCYMLQFLDKMTLSYSALLGIITDAKLVGSDFSWAGSIFYFGYLFWSFPASYLMVRCPIGKYLSISVLLWGAVLMCHAAVNNFAGLMVARFFLGMAEASVAPGFSLLMSMFYRRSEQPFRHGLWFAGNSIANIIGGVLAYAIGSADTQIASWRLLFLVFGAITVFWSVPMILLVPDSIEGARFLSARQKEVATVRVAENDTGIKSNTFQWSHVAEALRDPQAWLMFLWSFSSCLPNGGLTTFGSLLIAGFGYGRLRALLLQMPQGATQLLFVFVACYFPSRVKNMRLVLMFCLNSISLLGLVLIYAVPQQSAKLGGMYLGSIAAANMPLAMSMVSSNVAGTSKRTTVNAMLFIAYCAGNIAGPQFFKTSEAPSYPTGIKTSFIGFSLAAFFIVALRIYLPILNKRRDAKEGQIPEADIEERLEDKTDWQRDGFRYMY